MIIKEIFDNRKIEPRVNEHGANECFQDIR